MESGVDFILGILTIFCTVYVVMHLYAKWKNGERTIDKLVAGGSSSP